MMNIDAAKELLAYDRETGAFTWRVSRGGSAKAGSRAGSIDTRGYLQIKVHGRFIFAHRLAWALEHGAEPDSDIDHIDRNPLNNAIANLRLCTHAENHQNTGLRSDNSSGVTGVSYVKNSGKWLAYINRDGRRVRLGLFENFDDAVAARLKAKAEIHSFHPTQQGVRFTAPEYEDA